jgi:ribosomal protein S27E
MAVGDKAEIRGSRHYYNDGRAEIDLITSDHYLKKKDSEPAQFYIRPACQDVNGSHLDDVRYEFVDYPAYKGTCDQNEYLIAPGHGTYKVKFTKGDLEATVTLESHSKPFAGTVVTLRKKEGSIYATSTPSGANVYLDGTYKGTSPITISNVPVGTHTVKYTKTEYKDCEKTVTVYANQQRNVHCDLVPVQQTGSIYATSTPSGAKVYLDGTYKGTSPITISDVPVGTHTVKYTKTGYKDCEKTVTVYANQERSVHCDLDFTPEHITIGELVEKLEKGPESVVDKKFVTSGWVLVSTHEGYKGIEILWKILRIVSQIGSGGIVDIGKVPPQWLAPNFMVIWPNSIQDQNFCDSHKAFPYIEAYAASEDLWANSWDVVNMKGVVKKKNILWYTFYQFEVEEMDINPEYSDLEELLKSNEGDHVKFMCVVNKSLKVEIISPLGLCGSLHIQPKQTIDIPYQALVKVEGTIKDIKTIEDEGKERYEYYLEAESVEKILTVKEPSVKTAQTQTIAIQCPVNATITDQYGRIISDDGTNEIPDADMIVMEDMKIFYLPADLRYSVDIDAYDTGTFNFTMFSYSSHIKHKSIC